MHSAEHQAAVNEAVLIDQYGEEKNAPAAGFFGSPDDEDFEFIFTGPCDPPLQCAHGQRARIWWQSNFLWTTIHNR